MIWFVGAGPGAEDLITVRGQRLLMEADLVIYAGSLVNPELLKCCKESCEIRNSAFMTLEQVIDAMVQAEEDGKKVVRLHTGDPSLYGAIREQMEKDGTDHVWLSICWMKNRLRIRCVRGSVPLAERLQHCRQNIPCRTYPSRWLSPEWRDVHRFQRRNL